MIRKLGAAGTAAILVAAFAAGDGYSTGRIASDEREAATRAQEADALLARSSDLAMAADTLAAALSSAPKGQAPRVARGVDGEGRQTTRVDVRGLPVPLPMGATLALVAADRAEFAIVTDGAACRKLLGSTMGADLDARLEFLGPGSRVVRMPVDSATASAACGGDGPSLPVRLRFSVTNRVSVQPRTGSAPSRSTSTRLGTCLRGGMSSTTVSFLNTGPDGRLPSGMPESTEASSSRATVRRCT